MSLEVAVLSHDGALTLGVMSDRDTCPDAEVFVRGVEHTFNTLGPLEPGARLTLARSPVSCPEG